MATSWELEDHSGTTISFLPRGDSRRLSFRKREAPEATITLGLDDPDANKLIDALRNGVPILKVWREEDGESVLRHRGFIAPEAVREDLADANTMTITSTPIAKLEARNTPDIRAFDPTDAGLIAWTLIDEAQTGWPDASEPTADVGIEQGSLQSTYTAEPTYERKPIADTIRELADTRPGFDWELDPVDDGTTVAAFNVLTSQGVERDIEFAKGEGTLANCQLISRTRERLRNRVLVFGESGIVATQKDDASIARYGLWDHHESMSEEIDIDILDARAKELLTPFAKELIDVRPEPELAPNPLVDYDIGDTVRLFARVKGDGVDDYEFSGQVQVEGITLEFDSDGNESAHTLDVVPV